MVYQSAGLTILNGILASAIFLIISTAILETEGCFSSGVCGGGCPPPVCGGGCGQGYGCGQYGCYSMARARSAKTFSLEKYNMYSNGRMSRPSGEEGLYTLNQRFYSCCLNRHLPDSCLEKCTYGNYTRQTFQAMYLRFDSCPVQAAAEISYCAAQGQDHTKCCEREGVATTLAGTKCLIFCDQRPGNMTSLDLTYMPCYERFDSIKLCFMESEQPKDMRMARTFGQ